MDRPFLAILLMVAFCVLAPMIDVSSKMSTAGGIPVGQVTLARFAIQGLLMLALALAMGLGLAITRRQSGLLALRALFLVVATFAFVSGLKVMPIADALAINFVQPFILLLIGKFFLHEQVGPRRVIASIVGFAGCLLVIQPSIAAFGLMALWPLLTAVTFAGYILVTRQLAGGIHPITMQFHTGWIGAVIMLALLVVLGGGLGVDAFALVWPAEPVLWLWLFGVGFWGMASHLCMTYALRFASSSAIAPLQYLEIVAAVGLGWLFFNDFPNLMAVLGIVIITGSGLYLVHRERVVARRKAAALNA